MKRACLLSALLGALLLAFALPRLGRDDSLAQFFPAWSESRARFAAFEAAFGTDDTLLVTVRDDEEPPLLRPGALAYLDRLHAALAGDRALAGAMSLATLDDLRITAAFGVAVPLPPEPLVPRDRASVTGARAAELAAHPLLREGLVSDDGRTAACWLLLAPALRHAPDYLAEVERVAARVPAPLPEEGRLAVAVTGFPLLQSAALELLARDGALLLAGALLLVGGLVALTGVPLRLAAAWLASWLPVAGALAAWMWVAERPLHLFSHALLPLLLVTNGSGFVHVARAFAQEDAELRRRVVRTSAWTCATTVLGFATLLLAPLAPLARLGGEVALGSALSFAATLLFLCAFAPAVGARAPAAPRPPATSVPAPSRFARLARTPAWWIAPIALACLPWFLLRERPPAPLASFLDELPADHPRVVATRSADAAFHAQESFEIVVELDASRAAAQLLDPAFLVELAQFERELRADAGPDLARLLSPITFLRYVERRLVEAVAPADPPRAAAEFVANWILRPWLAFERAEPPQGVAALLYAALREPLAQVVTPDGTRLRFGGRIGALPPAQVRALAQRLRDGCFARWRERLGARSIDATGHALLVAEMADEARAAQLASLTAGGGVLALLLLVLLRDLPLALLAVAANALSISGLLELAAWSDRAVDLHATLLVAALLAVVIDNTLHLLVEWRHARSVAAGATAGATATERALASAAPGMLRSSGCLAAGFALFAASELPAWRQFAVGAVAGIALATFFDLVALPVALAWLERRRTR
ncbi:MAG: hypothetical protein JNL90_09670 [Planctomycetes bacterium]|nr:hypothetical protein [Planctomycetota bacterium]